MSDQEFITCLKKCLEKNESIISELNRLKKEMEDHREKCNAVKAVGTTASAFGTGVMVASFLAGPFTGGLSLVVSGAGVGASVYGAVINVVIDVVDSQKTSDIISEIKSLVLSKESLNEKLNKLVQRIMEKQEELLERYDLSDDINSAWTNLAAKVISKAFGLTLFMTADRLLLAMPITLTTIATSGIGIGQVATKTLGPIAISGKVIGQTTTKTPYFVAVGNKVAVDAASKTFNAVVKGGKIASKNAAKFAKFTKLMGKTAVGLSVVLTAFDIVFLVQDWTTCHPTVEVIDKVIPQLKEECQVLALFLEEMKTEMQQEEKKKKKEKKKECSCRPVQLKVLYLNARSVNPLNETVKFKKKLREIKLLIENHKPNIVVIVETWLRGVLVHANHKIKALLGLSNYKIYRQDRGMDNLNNAYTTDDAIPNPYRERRGGGIMVAYRPPSQYFKTKFSPDKNEDYGDNVMTFNLSRKNNCRQCFTKNRFGAHNQQIRMNFTAVYRRPKKFVDEDNEHFERINKAFIDRIYHLANIGYPDELLWHDGFCLVGDLNRDFRDGDDISEYLQDPFQCLSFDLGGTHRGGRTLDHVLADPPGMISGLTNMGFISDHSTLIFTINLPDDYPDGGNCEKCSLK